MRKWITKRQSHWKRDLILVLLALFVLGALVYTIGMNLELEFEKTTPTNYGHKLGQ